jgi:dCMP deaminase
MNEIIDWKPFLIEAYNLSRQSKDPSTQIGAIILKEEQLSTTSWCCSQGINEFPKGVKDTPDRWERPLKYKIIEHAERNAIFNAGKQRQSVHGATMVCNWACCCDCARAIIQSGIKKLVTHKQAHDRASLTWKEDIEIAFTMLREAGVEIVMYDGNLDVDFEVLHSGEKWKP